MCRSTTHYYGHGDEVIDPFTHHNWILEPCKCSNLPNNSFSISEDGHVAFSDKVNDKKTMSMALERNNKKHRINKLKLEDIPEDKELRIDDDDDDDNDDNNNIDVDVDADVYANPEVEEALEMDLEVLRRAFDMGIWVVCLGLGYMFSRANFRPPPTFS